MKNQRLAAYRQRLAELFSGYRAEWLNEKIFELFTEPSYFPHLKTSHPCFLEGGRGTGKTTALRCLSYQGQALLRQLRNDDSSDWPYFGLYYRINTNRVRAFSGGELQRSDWINMFGHYVNLEFSELLIRFLQWHRNSNPNAAQLGSRALGNVAVSLHIDQAGNLDQLEEHVYLTKLSFEAAVNNVGDQAGMPALSMQGSPIDALMREIKALPQFASRPFFFLIDEYENLDCDQQRVINTLIKHCGELYSFKVGVRELGFRERSTLNEGEQLLHPADYRLINIASELSDRDRFSAFAEEVCTQRLRHMFDDTVVPNLPDLFPELSAEDEAVRLGVREVLAPTLAKLQRGPAPAERLSSWLWDASPLEVFAVAGRALAEERSIWNKVDDILNNTDKWKEHYENYKYSYLFGIRRGKRGVRKYFAGWRVFCLLAASNIRYLLELVDRALDRHFEAGQGPEKGIDPDVQTRIAQGTGQRNLRELEGLSLNGAKLARFLLGLGRVFQVMAETPFGHAPEVAQFTIVRHFSDSAARRRVEELLADGVMHLALLRYPASKLQGEADVKETDYAIHPIFSAFFWVYS